MATQRTLPPGAVDPSEADKTLEYRPRRARQASATQEIQADDILETLDSLGQPLAIARGARPVPRPQPQPLPLPSVIVRRDSVAPSPAAPPAASPRALAPPPRRVAASIAPLAVDVSIELPALDAESIALEIDEPMPPLPRRKLGWVVAVAVLVSALVLVVGVVRHALAPSEEAPTLAALIAQKPKPAPASPAPTPSTTPASVSTTSASSAPPVVDVNSLPIAPKVGTVIGPAGRVYIDGVLVRAGSAMVPCGKHAVRVAPAWKARSVDVPCGGEIKVR